MIIVDIIITIITYFILMWVSVNLIGLLVRGFFTDPELEKLKREAHEAIRKEVKKDQRANKWINLFAFLLILGYLYATLRFGNIGVTVIALMLMATRLPDLLREIKTGEKTTRHNMTKTPLDYVTTLLDWAGLPALYYVLFL